jgi:hypothetical protein
LASGGRAGRNVTETHDELIPVSWVDSYRYPERRAGFIKGCPEGFEYGNATIFGYLEEACLIRVWCTHRNLVAPADLLYA